MSTAHKTDAEYVEHFDAPDVLEAKIDKLVAMIRESKHFIAFTGAGVSTSAGIADFRSGLNTVLPTGPGAWTVRAAVEKGVKVQRPKAGARVTTLTAIPTTTHMTLVALEQKGLLKYLISQNTDGLHRRSGFPPQRLSELHGNSNIEVCKKCGREYLRDFRVREAEKALDHDTSRKCTVPECGGTLRDTIINFTENLPEVPMYRGFGHAMAADLCLAMGSSLRVTPAADMPRLVAQRGAKLVVVNLQGTPLDDDATLRINAKCDDVMIRVAEKLKLDIPPFQLQRRVALRVNPMPLDRSLIVEVEGVEVDGIPASVFARAGVAVGEDPAKIKPQVKDEEPFHFRAVAASKDAQVAVTLAFRGHYSEPPVTLPALPAASCSRRYLLSLNPLKDNKWTVTALQDDGKREDEKEKEKGDNKGSKGKENVVDAKEEGKQGKVVDNKSNGGKGEEDPVKRVSELAHVSQSRAKDALKQFAGDVFAAVGVYGMRQVRD